MTQCIKKLLKKLIESCCSVRWGVLFACAEFLLCKQRKLLMTLVFCFRHQQACFLSRNGKGEVLRSPAEMVSVAFPGRTGKHHVILALCMLPGSFPDRAVWVNLENWINRPELPDCINPVCRLPNRRNQTVKADLWATLTCCCINADWFPSAHLSVNVYTEL